MAVPNQLPEISQFVRYFDHNGLAGYAIVAHDQPFDVQGEDFLMLITGSPYGVGFDYVTYDDQSDPPAPHTWRYDPRFPIGVFPADLGARLDALEAVDVGQLQSDLSAAQNDIAILQAAVSALQSSQSTQDEAISDNAGEISSIAGSVFDIEAAITMHTDALADLRQKYPAHNHGLLGLGDTPQGTNGDLDYELPGD